MSSVSKASLEGRLAHPGRSLVLQAAWIAAFAVAAALAAQWQIPHSPVPYTMQTLIVLLAGAFLGPRNGALSMLVYLAAGAVGLPVFAGGGFGLARLIGPTGGYLAAFPLAAALVGILVSRDRSIPWLLVSMAAGLTVVFFCGTLQLYALYVHNVREAIASGFLIFSWWDVIKAVAASMTYRELSRRWPRLPG